MQSVHVAILYIAFDTFFQLIIDISHLAKIGDMLRRIAYG